MFKIKVFLFEFNFFSNQTSSNINMIKKFLFFGIIIIALASCTKQQDPFEIGKRYVGLLTDSTQVKDLQMAFPEDSIATIVKASSFSSSSSQIEVYGKTGEKLLTLTAATPNDSTSTIKTVKIESTLYKTAKGITKKSTFKDIKDTYKINKIDNLIGSVVVSVNEINAAFTIDKIELPAELRFDNTQTIDQLQIPAKAKLKYFMLHW